MRLALPGRGRLVRARWNFLAKFHTLTVWIGAARKAVPSEPSPEETTCGNEDGRFQGEALAGAARGFSRPVFGSGIG
jgi:hypothetical protein